MRRSWYFILGSLLAVAQQPEPPATEALRLFREGFAAQKNAEESQSPDRALAQFQKAIEYYRQAVAADPSLCQAQLNWARCLAQAAVRLSQDPNRPAVVKAARERFAVTVRCPGVDWNAHADWARLLVGESGRVAELADRRELLREARTHLELALQSARFSAETAPLQQDLGGVLLLLGRVTAQPAEQGRLFKDALAQFEAAARVPAQAGQDQLYSAWGLTLAHLGKLQEDRMLFRQASERLLTALEKNPQNQEARYNLACVSALLGQAETAVRHLRVCLENDAHGLWLAQARQDRDLDGIRTVPEFQQLVQAGRLPVPAEIGTPRITDR